MGIMLSILTKRLCPLMTLALAFSCGKKINDPETTGSGTTQGQNQELPSTLNLQVNESLSSVKIYELPRNAWFKLPTKLLAREGNATGKKVRIYYNLLRSGDYEFKCSYRSLSAVTELPFEKCESRDGLEIISNSADLEHMVFPMDKGSSVKVELTNPTGSGMKIDSVYIVDWK
jgi:hypothetical protein